MDNLYRVQTRSEETGIKNFPTLMDALAAARDDASIWKISFDICDGTRVRLIWEDSKWVYQNMITGNYND